MTWLWWKQGGEIAALRTDLTAAYAEVETLRARPEVVSAPPPAAEPAALDPNAVLPAADAPDAAPAATGGRGAGAHGSEAGVASVPPAQQHCAAREQRRAAAPPAAARAPQPQTTQAQ